MKGAVNVDLQAATGVDVVADAGALPFRSHLAEHGLGTVAEIFDADAPHTPRGTIAQAWSVAEVLRGGGCCARSH